MSERLILFAKRPIHGRVKTRLAAGVGAAAALGIYRAFLDDQLRFIRALGSATRAVEACMDDRWTVEPGLAEAARGVPLTAQGPGDLGQRMLRVFRRAHRAGAAATVILGADAPTLPASRVDAAFAALHRGADVALVPVTDGGYALIGATRPWPELFTGIAWGGADVLERTRRRAREAGLELVELEGWYDVDEPRDLERLRADAADPATRKRAPATCRVLARGSPRDDR